MTDLATQEKAALLSGATTWETRAFPGAGVRALVCADGPHGVRRQLGASDHLGLNPSARATCFPPASTLACSWDPALLSRVGEALGREAASLEVDLLLGPAMNVVRDPLGGRTFEYFSEDPLLTGRLAAAYVRGVQSQGVGTTPKHFAANAQETRRMVSDSRVDEATLRELYLTAFEIVVREAQPRAIMSSYNLVNGVHAHENAHLLTEILRDEWGFDGVVVSDWGGVHDVVESVRAGGTLQMPSAGLGPVAELVAAVEDGSLPMAALDARVDEMRRLAAVPKAPPTPFDVEAHHGLAREAAAASTVLLANDGVLPLAPHTTVALVGDFCTTPRYQGAGSSLVNPTRLSTLVDALPAAGVDVVASARGYARNSAPDPVLVQEALNAAAQADLVVLFVGLDEVSETEGRDRADLGLPKAQRELTRTLIDDGYRVVVALAAGSPVELGFADGAAALVHTHLGGQAGAEALADVLVGAVCPSGRLAHTYVHRHEDLPTAGNFPAQGDVAEYAEGLLIGHRYATAAGLTPRYPFGFGLSYTTFKQTDLRLSSTGITVTVTNTGDRAGADVVQLWVAGPPAPGRPVRELKGFAKVELAPGEARDVTIDFDSYTFRRFDSALDAWEETLGLWEIMIAADAEHPTASGWLRLDAAGRTVAPAPAEVPAPSPAARRPGPSSRQDKPRGRRLLTAEATLGDLAHARLGLARLAAAILGHRISKADRAGHPDLNMLFLQGMPLRALATMTGGAVDSTMVAALVDLVNGQPSALPRLVQAAWHNRTGARTLTSWLQTSEESSK